ncbi:hypothetical protein D1122_05765 [Cereibacter sphaeroides]|nr:hypothetical protein D1122_05765 [Cereibacter sphaeroides]
MPGCGPGTGPSDLFRRPSGRRAGLGLTGFRGRVRLHDPLRAGRLSGGSLIPVGRGGGRLIPMRRRRCAVRGLRVARPGGRDMKTARLTLRGHEAEPADRQHGQEDDDSEHICHLNLPLAR